MAFDRFYTLKILLFVSLVQILEAEPGVLHGFFQKMGDADFAMREKAQAALVTHALEEPTTTVPKIIDYWRKAGGDMELEARLYDVLEVLYQRVELGVGSAKLDARVGWFLYHDGKYLSSYPHIIEVEEGGAAEAAGLQAGDVLLKINEVNLWSDESVTRLKNYLKSMKPGEVARLELRRNGRGRKRPFSKSSRSKREVIEVTTSRQDEVPEESVEEEFKVWLERTSTK